MMLFKKDPHDPKLVYSILYCYYTVFYLQVKCRVDDFNYEIYMFAGQEILQKALVLTALGMIPILLFGKPLYMLWQRTQRPSSYANIEDEGLGAEGETSGEQHEEGFGDILIIQGGTDLI